MSKHHDHDHDHDRHSAHAKAQAHQETRGISTTAAWDGSYNTIVKGVSQTMTPPAAFTLVALTNLGNGAENVILTWGGAGLQQMNVAPQQNAPAMYINNFSPNNLTVFNQGPASTIGAIVAGFGQGGITPTPIKLATPLAMAPNTYAQGTSNPNIMDLNFSVSTGALTTFVVMGGIAPNGNTTRAIVIQLNAGSVIGPATGTLFNNSITQPTGSSLDPTNNLVYAATTAAQYDLLYNFGASNIWIANVSPTTAAGASITLTSLG